MKKLIITAMALTCVAAVVSADTVTSENVVGYNKKATQAGLQLLGMQFIGETNATPKTIFGDTLPVGSKVFLYENDGAGGGGYVFATYVHPPMPPGAANKWDSEPIIDLGKGFWVQLPLGVSSTNTIISGDVLMTTSKVANVLEGLQLIANPYPYEIEIVDLDITPELGDKIFKYTNDGVGGGVYSFATYIHPPMPPGAANKWDDESLTIGVGQGFWYQSAKSGTNTLVWAKPAGL